MKLLVVAALVIAVVNAIDVEVRKIIKNASTESYHALNKLLASSKKHFYVCGNVQYSYSKLGFRKSIFYRRRVCLIWMIAS